MAKGSSGVKIVATLILIAPVGVGAQQNVMQYPPKDIGAETLDERRAAQLETLDRFEVFTGFSFQDRVLSSGIDFVHESVDDSLKNWMPVHYDHGNGVVVADVDGDQRYDIYLLTQLGGNRLYRNLGGGKFEDITATAGVELGDRIGVTASFADLDNDGDPDLYVTTVRNGNALFLNDGRGRFEDVTKAAGLEYSGHSSGVVIFDYDNDGLLDLFLTNVGLYTTDKKGRGGFYRGIEDAFFGHLFPERSERSILYRNLGDGKFRDVSESAELVDESWSGDGTFTDLDGDLYPELYVLNMQGDDHYYKNEQGKRFVDKTSSTFAKTPWGAMGVKFFDYDNNGRMDLIITDMHSDMHSAPVHPLRDEKKKYPAPADNSENNILGNAFFVQREDSSFQEVSDSIGAENFWPWGVSVGDLNADGFEDVFIASSMNFPFRYGVNTVLLNNKGKVFLDSEFILGVEPRRDGRTHKPLFQVDCAGAEKGHEACQVAASRSLKGTVTVAGTLGTRASVVWDLDDDGDLDIVTNEFNDGPQVLISDLSQKKKIRFLKVRLRGSRSNRDGLGAHVKVRAGALTLTRYHDGKSGYLSQSAVPLYFGLGDEDEIESVEVRWPSGHRQVVNEGIELNSLIEIAEPSAKT